MLCLARLRAIRTSEKNEVLGSIRRVGLTQSTPRQASIREKKGPSLGKIQVKLPHQRSPYAMKFEDRSQEETERHQRCARGKAWNCSQAQRKGQSCILFACRRVDCAGRIHHKTRGKRVCGRLRSKYAHGQQERP